MSKYPAKIEKITRRDFLNTAGAAAAGGLVVVAGSSLLGGNQANAATTSSTAPTVEVHQTRPHGSRKTGV